MPAPSVDVYDGDGALMGVILGLDISKHRGTSVSFPTSLGLAIGLEKVYRSLKIEEGEERSGIYLREILAERRVPPDADRYKEHGTFKIVYKWPVIQVDDLETSELLFDEPSFVPEGKPCAASMAERTWWMTREGGTRWFTGGTLSAGTIAAGTITASKFAKPDPSTFGPLDDFAWGTPSLAVPALGEVSMSERKVSKPKIVVRESDIKPDIKDRLRQRIEEQMARALRGLGKR